MHETNEKITALYCRLSHEDSMQGESNSIYVYEKKEKWSRTEGNDIDIVFTVGFREQHTVRTSDAIAS